MTSTCWIGSIIRTTDVAIEVDIDIVAGVAILAATLLILLRHKLRKSANDAALCVTRGLDPRVHLLRKKMDCRVKPGNDAEFYDAVALIGLTTAGHYAMTIGEFNTDEHHLMALAWYTSGFIDRAHFETVEFALWYYGPWFQMLTALVQSLGRADPVTVRHAMTFLIGVIGLATLLPIALVGNDLRRFVYRAGYRHAHRRNHYPCLSFRCNGFVPDSKPSH